MARSSQTPSRAVAAHIARALLFLAAASALALTSAAALSCNVRDFASSPGTVQYSVGNLRATAAAANAPNFTACYSYNLLMYDTPTPTWAASASGPWTCTGPSNQGVAAACALLPVSTCFGTFSGGWPDETLFPGSSTMQGDPCTLMTSQYLWNSTTVQATSTRSLPPAPGTYRSKASYGTYSAPSSMASASCCSSADNCNSPNQYSFTYLPVFSAPPPSPTQGAAAIGPATSLGPLGLAVLLLMSLSMMNIVLL